MMGYHLVLRGPVSLGEIESWMFGQKARVYILDGDNTRLGINSDLSFSDEDRTENIRRVAEICKLFNDAGVIVIASFISPFASDRLIAKNLIGAADFIEVFTDSSINTCCERDTKGLYKLAIGGKLKNFTGISSPYEQPLMPDIHLCTDKIFRINSTTHNLLDPGSSREGTQNSPRAEFSAL